MRPLEAAEIRGCWGTLLLAWDEADRLDLGRVADEIDALVAARVSGIYSCGTAGEFHALGEEEFDRVSALLAERCESAGMPFQLGVSHMSAQVSRERLRRVVALAPSAVQVILPDWLVVHADEAVAFLEGMAELADGIGLVLYNPPHAKRVLTPPDLGELARRVPSLVGVKVAGGDDAWYDAVRRAAGRLSLFVPGHHLATGYVRGASGSYSNVACLDPGAAARWWEAIESGDPRAVETERRLRAFFSAHIEPFIAEQGFPGAACDRLLARIGGWADVGWRMRWPYRSIPAGEADRLRPIARELLPEFVRGA